MVNTLKRIYAFLKKHPGKVRAIIVILLFTVLFMNVHPQDILAAFRQANTNFLAISLIMLIPNLFLQFLKWNFILRVVEPKPPKRLAFISLFGGFFLAASTPGRTGELARGLLMPGYSNVRIASLTVVDKGFSQIMVWLFGCAALGLLLPFPLSILPYAGILVVIGILFNIHRMRPVIERFLGRFTHSEMINNALAAFDALSYSTIIGMFSYSILFYLTFTIQFFFILNCFTDVPVMIGIKAIPLIFLINSALPISIGDFGMKDFAAVQVLGLFGIPAASVLSATLTQNSMTFLVPSLVGGILFTMTKHPPIKEARS